MGKFNGTAMRSNSLQMLNSVLRNQSSRIQQGGNSNICHAQGISYQIGTIGPATVQQV
jgi:hypothetical protein